MSTLNPQYMLAPSIQEYFVDKDTGLPMAGGKVFFYADDSRSTLKPVYTLTGNPGTYNYDALPNPVILNAVGTFSSNGTDDVLPYYYPYSLTNPNVTQLYYIVVQNADDVPQFTRQAYPNLATSSSDTSSASYNFVRNPQFYSWNNGVTFGGANGLISLTDNDFIADDWAYQNDDFFNSSIMILRQSFGTSNVITGNPAYYLEYKSSGGTVQTLNNIYQKYNSALTLAGQIITVGIWLRCTSAVTISVSLTQYFGTGGSPSPSVETFVIPTAITSSGWQLFTGSVTLPSTATKILGTNGDDALYLNVNLPLNTSCTVDISNVSLQIGQNPTFPIKSNDDNNKATNYDNPYSIFRTGDVKMTLRTTNDPGWLLMDDGTIGNSFCGATHTGLQYKSLYSLIWNNVNGIFAPIYTSAGIPTSRGSTSDADWNANNQLSLTRALGRVMAGAAPSGYTFPIAVSSYDSTHLVIGFGGTIIFNATAITFSVFSPGSLPSPLNTSTTYYLNGTSGQIYNNPNDAVNGVNNITLSGGALPFYVNLAASAETSLLGQPWGEDYHYQIAAEIASHNHTIPALFNQATAPAVSTAVALSAGSTPTGFTGGNTAFNIVQPTTYMNVMIKV